MNQKFLRIYKKLDVLDIKQSSLIYGDLSANCANCQAIDIKLDAHQCPECGAGFKYIAFRNIKNHLPKLQKLNAERPDLLFVDYEDFAKNLGVIKAQEFFK